MQIILASSSSSYAEQRPYYFYGCHLMISTRMCLQDNFRERLILMVLFCIFAKVLQLYTFCLPSLFMVLSCDIWTSLVCYPHPVLSTSLLFWSSPTGLHERESGALLVVPLHYSAVKLKAMSVVWRHWSLAFLSSSNQWLLRIGISKMWWF